MAAPLTTSRNKYHSNIKDSTVYTPDKLSEYIYKIVSLDYTLDFNNKTIFDPAVGKGSLLRPFKKHSILSTSVGMDIDDNKDRNYLSSFIHKSFLSSEEKDYNFKPDLVILNPPLNTDKRNKKWLKENKLGKALLSEIFTDKVFELFGDNIPYILITSMGFLLNQRKKSKRWKKYSNHKAQITSILSLPLDIFPNVEFHIEVLFWNMPYLKPHYWYDEKYL